MLLMFTILPGLAVIAFSLLAPLGAEAQQPAKVPRIGLMIPERRGDAGVAGRIEAFRQGLRELG